MNPIFHIRQWLRKHFGALGRFRIETEGFVIVKPFLGVPTFTIKPGATCIGAVIVGNVALVHASSTTLRDAKLSNGASVEIPNGAINTTTENCKVSGALVGIEIGNA